MNRCFFIGNHDAPEEIYPLICSTVEHHISHFGVCDFLVGHYGNFDRMAARAVIAAKLRHPYITLTLLLPYYPLNQSFALAEGFDCSLYPENISRVPKRAAIAFANRYCINTSDYLIAYSRYSASNSGKLLSYAQALAERKPVHITNLAVDIA